MLTIKQKMMINELQRKKNRKQLKIKKKNDNL